LRRICGPSQARKPRLTGSENQRDTA
jgi:hypothetical protein